MAESLINEEVYVVVEDFDNLVDIVFCDDLPDAFEYLKLLSPEEHYDMKVLHGVLTKAESIPADLMNRECFIIIVVPTTGLNNVGLKGVIIESDAGNYVEILAEEVEEVVSKAYKWSPVVDIDDIYILYGYHVDLGLCINEDSLDEENIEICKKVSEAAEEIIRHATRAEEANDRS